MGRKTRFSIFTALAVAVLAGPASFAAARIKIEDIKIGKGVAVKKGMGISFHYTGRVQNGVKVFDTREDPGQPFGMLVGSGGVIPGLAEGVIGMRTGGVRRIIVPPELAYGKSGSAVGVIPPNATMEFEVELLGVLEKPKSNPEAGIIGR